MNINILLETVVYILLWIFVFVLTIIILDKITPWSLEKEIIEDENVALAIIIGCSFIAIAIIIASAING